jgi:hypothetical protein
LDQHQRRSFNAGRIGQGVPLFDSNFDRNAYNNGRLVRSCETPWFKANEQNNSRARAASDSGPEISLGIALLLLAGFAMVVLVVAGIIGALNSSEKPDNFTRGQASPPRPAVYEVRRVSSTPVFVGAEGVDLRIRPDFGARLPPVPGHALPVHGSRTQRLSRTVNTTVGFISLPTTPTDGHLPALISRRTRIKTTFRFRAPVKPKM